MSNELATFIPPQDSGLSESQPLSVTAFVGGELYGHHAVQLTIGMNYCCLTTAQVAELVNLLLYRLDGDPSTSATGPNLDLEFDAQEMDHEK